MDLKALDSPMQNTLEVPPSLVQIDTWSPPLGPTRGRQLESAPLYTNGGNDAGKVSLRPFLTYFSSGLVFEYYMGPSSTESRFLGSDFLS